MNRLALAIMIALSLNATACCRAIKTGCRWKRVAATTIVLDLNDPRPDVRREAAMILRTRDGVPEAAIQPLVTAVIAETDLEARGEMVLTLGHSGSAIAIPHIEAMLRSSDPAARRYGADALWSWRIAHALEDDITRPDGWRE